MSSSRTMTVLLALIILIKSLNCVIGESVFLGGSDFISAHKNSVALAAASPIAPLHPGPMERGCTDSGCLCKGFVEAPEVVVPEPSESLDDWARLTAALIRLSGTDPIVASGVLLFRPGDDLFADASPSGRALRQQYASLTL